MGRRDYRYFVQNDFRGGICDQPENAQPNQVLDARNVWSPAGVLEQRPGYSGVATEFMHQVGVSASPTIFAEDTNASTFTSAGSTITFTANYHQARTASVAGDRWYIKHSATFYGLNINPGTFNTAGTQIKVEYYNGSAWVYLQTTQEISTSIIPHVSTKSQWAGSAWTTAAGHLYHASSEIAPYAGNWLFWATPKDWASTTVNSTTGYFVRLTLLTADMDVNTTITSALVFTLALQNRGMFPLQFSSYKRVLACFGVPITGASTSYASVSIQDGFGFKNRVSYLTQTGVPTPIHGVKSVVVIPDFEDIYYTYDYNIYHLKPFPVVSQLETGYDDFLEPVIEDRPEYVGTVNGVKSPYHQDSIAQAGAFPQARFLTYYQNQLFAFNLLGNRFGFRWSAPTDATLIGYRVWPDESQETLEEDDNSEITGVATLNEHLIVFKGDSIWRIVLVTQNDLGLNVYQAIRVVAGIGCVSHSSIVATPKGLVFLSDDGVYIFDGTSVAKISGNIDATMALINPSRKELAWGVNWQTKSCYLLSMPTSGSDKNNLVVVWDYKHNAWWTWNNIQANCWLRMEEQNDSESIYFADDTAAIYRMGVGDTDHGQTISSYVTTNRMLYDTTGVAKCFREVVIDGSSDVSSLAVTLFQDDRDNVSSATMTMTETADTLWSAGTYSTSVYCSRKRRLKRLMYSSTGNWAQLKIANSNKNQRMIIRSLAVGYTVKGAR